MEKDKKSTVIGVIGVMQHCNYLEGEMLKAIETEYKGYKFRSRLEARWAVFLDALGTEWVYEGEGYDLDGVYYLPDFFLPYEAQDCYLEIKGQYPTDTEVIKAKLLAEKSGKDVYILWGECWFLDNITSGSVHLSPYPDRQQETTTPIICLMCGTLLFANKHFIDSYGGMGLGYFCNNCDVVDRSYHDRPVFPGVTFHKGQVFYPARYSLFENERLNLAYKKARQARFEHGEKPE